MKSKTNLIFHYERYPKLQIEDVFKYLYQSAFGSEHLIRDEKDAADYIKREFSEMKGTMNAPIEALDGDYSRVSLSLLSEGLKAETLARIFYLSAKTESSEKEKLINDLKMAKELVENGELPFSKEAFEQKNAAWANTGYAALHHSAVFRAEYKPHYRVISNKYAPFLPFFAETDKLMGKGRVVIAIEGGSASGKTTLGKMLEEIYDCNVFHMDDFFLRPEQRTPERFSEVGGNIDRERFLSEVLIPLSEGKGVCFRKFDCSTQTLGSPITVSPKSLNFVEGAYSMHPQLAKYYDFSLFLDISPEMQRKRILVRNNERLAKRFFDEWIPMELRYFTETQIKDRCNMII